MGKLAWLLRHVGVTCVAESCRYIFRACIICLVSLAVVLWLQQCSSLASSSYAR
jgi:hypothetical protein